MWFRAGWLTAILVLTLVVPAGAYTFRFPGLGDVTFYGSNYFCYGRNSVYDYAPDVEAYDQARNRLSLNFQARRWTLGVELWTQTYDKEEDVPVEDYRDPNDLYPQSTFWRIGGATSPGGWGRITSRWGVRSVFSCRRTSLSIWTSRWMVGCSSWTPDRWM